MLQYLAIFKLDTYSSYFANWWKIKRFEEIRFMQLVVMICEDYMYVIYKQVVGDSVKPVFNERTISEQGYFLRTVSPHVKESVIKGHLSCRDTCLGY